MAREITVTIPGEPFALMRARSSAQRMGGKVFARHYDPKENRSWKGAAQVVMMDALRRAGMTAPAFGELCEVEIVAVFSLPKGQHRKRSPVPRRRSGNLKDWDNVGKAVCDAGNGVLWLDDHLIARGSVEKWTGAQGEAPHVRITVREIDAQASTDELLFDRALDLPLPPSADTRTVGQALAAAVARG